MELVSFVTSLSFTFIAVEKYGRLVMKIHRIVPLLTYIENGHVEVSHSTDTQ